MDFGRTVNGGAAAGAYNRAWKFARDAWRDGSSHPAVTAGLDITGPRSPTTVLSTYHENVDAC